VDPFWIETGNQLRLAIVPRPRSGDWLDDEAILMKKAGIDIFVSMLQPQEASELGLRQKFHQDSPCHIRAMPA
jgi:hypothetical protein